MASEITNTRRRHGSLFKAIVLAQCDEPGMSVAKTGMSRSNNDNIVRRWRQLARPQRLAPAASASG